MRKPHRPLKRTGKLRRLQPRRTITDRRGADERKARDAFKTLSASIEPLAAGEKDYTIMTCAMANADWVQTSAEVKNPYLGQSMQTCGEPKKIGAPPAHGGVTTRTKAAAREYWKGAATRHTLPLIVSRMPIVCQQRARSPVLAEYARLAASYDKRWSFYIEATARETIARLAAHPGERLLDVGCGTGALLCQLARTRSQAQLAGIDPVPEMLAIARRRLPPAVDLRESWAERLPFESGHFDAVTCCSVLHYVREPIAALREMNRVLRPGGILVVTDWCADDVVCRALGWYLRRVNRAVFKVYRRHEFLRLLQEAGHTGAVIDRCKIDWLWGLMTAVVTKPAV